MADTPGGPGSLHIGSEPTLEEQIAAYQREFQDLDPQVEQIVSALSRLNRRMNVAYGRQTSALGISNTDWEVLKALVLSGAPYRMGPGDLAKRLGLTPAAMTHRIDRMVTEGLVNRERDESNRVRVIVELTAEGREKWLEAMRLATVFEEDLLQTCLLRSGRRSATSSPASCAGWSTPSRTRADASVTWTDGTAAVARCLSPEKILTGVVDSPSGIRRVLRVAAEP